MNKGYRGLPHGGPISYGFSGWTPVSDGMPPDMAASYLACYYDGEVSIIQRGAAKAWESHNGKPVIAWARIPMIDYEAFRQHYDDKA